MMDESLVFTIINEVELKLCIGTLANENRSNTASKIVVCKIVFGCDV